ncbi:MAG: DUF2848 family protein [Terriglobia bacterium]
MKLTLEIVSIETDHKRTVEFEPKLVVCAEFSGWKQVLGGDQKASIEKNEESSLERSPHFIPVSPYLLTNENKIVVQGKHTSGEVEYVALKFEDEIYLTVGSDHCDRQAEAFSFAKSKQLCPKVMARQMILHREIRSYRDELRLSSSVASYDRKVPYQSAFVADLMRLGSLIRCCPLNLDFNGAVLFSGTVPTIADIPAYTSHFYFQLDLARLNLTIAHDYAIEMLPEAR